MATFFNILLLALIVATTGNLISNFKGKNRTYGACVASEALFVFFAFHPATLHFYRH